MTAALVGVLAMPMIGAAAVLSVGDRLRVARGVTVVALSTQLVAAITLLIEVRDGDVVTVNVGGHAADIGGVVLVADALAGLLVAVAAIVLTAVHLFSIAQRQTDEGWARFHAVYLTLSVGVMLAFLTGDLFTLFVAFELTLVSSYVLLTYGGRPSQTRAGMTYTIINILAGLLLLTTIALIYAATGTLNMAQLADRFATLDPTIRLLLGTFLLVPFAIKAAVFPLFSWLPDAYPTAPTPITAVFAALLTKLGVYAIARTHTLLGLTNLGPLLVAIAIATMVVGVLGALVQRDIKRILSFHAVSQIGYLLFGVALFNIGGLAAAIVFLVHYIVTKTGLFLVAATIEDSYGSGSLAQVSGLLRRAPLLAVLFAVGAASLIGIPPTSGFISKLALVQAGLSAGAWLGVATVLVVSAGTLLSMTKIWQSVFWGPESSEPTPSPRLAVMLPTAGLVVISVLLAVGANDLLSVATEAARGLIDPSEYIAEVLG